MEGVAAGLGAMGFWIFIAAVVVGGIWGETRKRESQQETLRRMVESGEKVDPVVVQQLMSGGASKDLARELTTAGVIVLFVAPGLAVMGWFLGKLDPKVFQVLLGVSFMVGLVAIGLLVAAAVAKRWDRQDQI